MRGAPWSILLLLASMSARTFAADWRPIGDDALSLLLLNYDSVQVLPLLGTAPTLYLFRWARVYREPKALLAGRPLAKHHVFGVTATCDSAPSVFVTFEETRTEAFDVIASVESEKFPLSDDVRKVSDLPGMANVRTFVCSNKQLWKITPPNHERR